MQEIEPNCYEAKIDHRTTGNRLLLTLVTEVGVVSADHTSECDYALTWHIAAITTSWSCIDETARGYYFEMDGDAEVY